MLGVSREYVARREIGKDWLTTEDQLAITALKPRKAQSIQGQLHLLPLVLARSPDYASTGWFPNPPQVWIPRPRLRVAWRASHSQRT